LLYINLTFPFISAYCAAAASQSDAINLTRNAFYFILGQVFLVFIVVGAIVDGFDGF